MEDKRTIFVYIGIELAATTEEIEKVIQGNKEIFDRLVSEKQFKLVGDDYIPSFSIDEYNEQYGTDYISETTEL